MRAVLHPPAVQVAAGKLAGVMAVANVLGSLAGARLALRFGAAFVRKAFIAVVSGLIIKLAIDRILAR